MRRVVAVVLVVAVAFIVHAAVGGADDQHGSGPIALPRFAPPAKCFRDRPGRCVRPCRQFVAGRRARGCDRHPRAVGVMHALSDAVP